MIELPLLSFPDGTILPAPKELKLTMLVAKLLYDHCRSGWRYTHFPAGELRDKRTAAKLKAMGLTPGWPDFQLFSSAGKPHFLEVKRHGGRLSADQAEFRLWCSNAEIPHCTARNLDDVCMIFDEWDCLRIKFAPD